MKHLKGETAPTAAFAILYPGSGKLGIAISPKADAADVCFFVSFDFICEIAADSMLHFFPC